MAEPGHVSNSSQSSEPARVFSEPEPEWEQAIDLWGTVVWGFHQYGIGSLFLLLALSSLGSIIRTVASKRESKQKMVSLVLLALGTVYGTARGISLCIDAYSHKKALPAFVKNLLWGIAQPCLVTGYTLFFIVVRNALTLKGRFQAWFTTRNILLVGSLPYLGIVIISELLVTFAPSHAIVSFVCQLIYTVINFALSLFYFTLARQLNFKFGTNNRAAQRASGRRMVFFRCACVAVAAGGLALSAAQVYAMSGEFSVFSRARFVAAWPWFGFNTAVRVLELYLSVVLLVLASYQGNRSAVEEAREGN